MKEICYVLLCNLRQVTHITPLRMVTFIDSKTKYRKTLSLVRFLALLIEPYKDVLSINMFCLVFLKLEFSFAVFFLQSTKYIPINFVAYLFIVLSNLKSNRNNLVKIVFIRVFLVDCSICINISLIALKISKFFLSESILINYNQVLGLLIFVFLFRKQFFS